MKVGFGCDHVAVELKQTLMEHLKEKGYECVDYGAYDPNVKVNYPEPGLRVAEAIMRGEVEKGVLICGTGIGISLAANKVPGICLPVWNWIRLPRAFLSLLSIYWLPRGWIPWSLAAVLPTWVIYCLTGFGSLRIIWPSLPIKAVIRSYRVSCWMMRYWWAPCLLPRAVM